METTTALPKIISVDDHTVEPSDVWQNRLPKKYLDTGPRIVRAPLKEISFLGGRFKPVMGAPGDDGPLGDWWLYEGLQRPLTRLDTAVGYSRDEIKLEVITYEQMRPGSYDVPQRLADMDVNHVQSAVCFPTFPRFCGQTFTEAKDHELGLLCVQAYNDWMVEEWCGPDAQGRLIPLTLIPLWDAELAAAEVRRNAARGVRAVAFSEIPPTWACPPSTPTTGTPSSPPATRPARSSRCTSAPAAVCPPPPPTPRPPSAPRSPSPTAASRWSTG